MLHINAMLVFVLLILPVSAKAEWVYIAPPWNFDVHPRYDGNNPHSIPISEWEQLATFDSAKNCEKMRLFARKIRLISANDRERLLVLFAAGEKSQARQEATILIAQERWLSKRLKESGLPKSEEIAQRAESDSLKRWSASKCSPTPLR